MDTKLLQGSPFRPLVLASAVCLLGAASAGASQSASPVPSVTVKYRDLNLNTIEGANTLYRRIRGAARTVCGEEGRALFEQQAWRACFEDALARAVATVNSPLLTGAHGQASRPAV